MRAFIVIALLTAASPAAAQLSQFQLDDLRARQEAAERRAIDQSNQLMALEARQRAADASLDLQIQRGGVRAPELRYEPLARAPSTATPKFPSIPDAALADSNRRVQDAAKNRR
jgi:hypothetical protein